MKPSLQNIFKLLALFVILKRRKDILSFAVKALDILIQKNAPNERRKLPDLSRTRNRERDRFNSSTSSCNLMPNLIPRPSSAPPDLFSIPENEPYGGPIRKVRTCENLLTLPGTSTGPSNIQRTLEDEATLKHPISVRKLSAVNEDWDNENLLNDEE